MCQASYIVVEWRGRTKAVQNGKKTKTEGREGKKNRKDTNPCQFGSVKAKTSDRGSWAPTGVGGLGPWGKHGQFLKSLLLSPTLSQTSTDFPGTSNLLFYPSLPFVDHFCGSPGWVRILHGPNGPDAPSPLQSPKSCPFTPVGHSRLRGSFWHVSDVTRGKSLN